MWNPFFNESRTTLPLNVLFKAFCHAKKKQKEKTLNYPYLYKFTKISRSGNTKKTLLQSFEKILQITIYYRVLQMFCFIMDKIDQWTIFSLSWLRVIIKNPCLGWLEGRRYRSMLLSPPPSQTCQNSSTNKYLMSTHKTTFPSLRCTVKKCTYNRVWDYWARKSDVFDAISQFRGYSISTFMSANPKKISEYTNAPYRFH